MKKLAKYKRELITIVFALVVIVGISIAAVIISKNDSESEKEYVENDTTFEEEYDDTEEDFEVEQSLEDWNFNNMMGVTEFVRIEYYNEKNNTVRKPYERDDGRVNRIYRDVDFSSAGYIMEKDYYNNTKYGADNLEIISDDTANRNGHLTMNIESVEMIGENSDIPLIKIDCEGEIAKMWLVPLEKVDFDSRKDSGEDYYKGGDFYDIKLKE